MSPEVRRIRDESELEQALALRREVFVAEQGVPVEEELDGRDGEAIQLVAVDADGLVQATCRLLADEAGMRVGRLCVRADRRRQGLGAALLAEAEREARAAGASVLAMHAQVTAMPLYERIGYVPVGEPFDEAGIEHLAMEKTLA